MTDSRQVLGRLLGPGGSDPGCDVWADVLDQFVEAEATGRAAAKAFPGLARHLEACPDCHEDHKALLELLTTTPDDPLVPPA